ncbi:MAG: hypothetical protein LBT64_00135 [Puniceicoccales bacterium]|nr:hypothetical protein [Puniceicoccales bacterium]
MKILIGTVILAGGREADEEPYDLKISNSRSVQMSSSVRASTAKVFDRGNQQTAVEFKVSKKHHSSADAQSHVLQLASSLKTLPPTLTVIEEPSNATYSLGDAAMEDVQSTCSGIVSTHVYRIIGGNFTKN